MRKVLSMFYVCLAGCSGQMEDSGRMKPFEMPPPTNTNGSVWLPVPGTVPYSTNASTRPGITMALMIRGGQRYDIYCAPCHDKEGTGRGAVVERGFTAPKTFRHSELLSASDEHIYKVISAGYGAMAGQAGQVPPNDRWAIVAYVRALQRLAADTNAPAGKEASAR